MDDMALLILKQIMHMNEKENTSRDNSFIYNKTSLNSNLVFIKTLCSFWITTIERFLKGIGANT